MLQVSLIGINEGSVEARGAYPRLNQTRSAEFTRYNLRICRCGMVPRHPYRPFKTRPISHHTLATSTRGVTLSRDVGSIYGLMVDGKRVRDETRACLGASGRRRIGKQNREWDIIRVSLCTCVFGTVDYPYSALAIPFFLISPSFNIVLTSGKWIILYYRPLARVRREICRNHCIHVSHWDSNLIHPKFQT